MRYTAVVKGGLLEAAQAAEARGFRSIPLAHNEESRYVTLEILDESPAERLNRWFVEDILVEKGKPFPDGSLLVWSEHPRGFEHCSICRRFHGPEERHAAE